MGFHALFEREDVLAILQKTLQNYYSSRFPEKKIEIGFEKREGAAEFFLVPRIGMILQKNPDKEISQRFYSDYNIRNNIVKNLAAKTLVFASLHFPKLMAIKQRLYIWPKELVNDKTAISYCNRSIRIFDYQKETTVSIQKDGFTDKFFQNQLQFRRNHNYTFIPELLDSGEQWFEEKIQVGSILARVTDTQQYENAQNQALRYMAQLQKDSSEPAQTRTYLSALQKRLETQLQETANKKATTCHNEAVQYLHRLCAYLNTAPETIPTVISHKDLQGGNILVTPQRLWIIDWETQGRGSRWFDAITMLYGTRYYGGIRRLVQDVQADALPEQIGAAEGWSAKQILAVFLLEDLEFYLEDMLELSGTAGSATFDRYMTEILEIDWKTVF